MEEVTAIIFVTTFFRCKRGRQNYLTVFALIIYNIYYEKMKFSMIVGLLIPWSIFTYRIIVGYISSVFVFKCNIKDDLLIQPQV